MGKEQHPPSSNPKLRGVTITLSGAQITRLLYEVTGSSGLRGRLLGQLDVLRVAVDGVLADREFERRRVSLAGLRLFGVLCAFVPPGSERGIHEVAEERDLKSSTTNRYVQTLVAVGLLEQVSHSRKYRIPPLVHDEDTGET